MGYAGFRLQPILSTPAPSWPDTLHSDSAGCVGHLHTLPEVERWLWSGLPVSPRGPSCSPTFQAGGQAGACERCPLPEPHCSPLPRPPPPGWPGDTEKPSGYWAFLLQPLSPGQVGQTTSGASNVSWRVAGLEAAREEPGKAHPTSLARTLQLPLAAANCDCLPIWRSGRSVGLLSLGWIQSLEQPPTPGHCLGLRVPLLAGRGAGPE